MRIPVLGFTVDVLSCTNCANRAYRNGNVVQEMVRLQGQPQFPIFHCCMRTAYHAV